MNNITPEFLLWSIRKDCLLRDEVDENHGHKVLRQLRPLRAWSDCQENDRICEGICVQLSRAELKDMKDEHKHIEHKGFRAEEMFEFYGGADFVKSQCHGCSANAAATFFDESLASCAGMLQVDELNEPLPVLVEAAIDELSLAATLSDLFLRTTPSWYGIWSRSITSDQQLKTLEAIFGYIIESLDKEVRASHRPLLELHEAIRRARSQRLPLDVEIFPQGELTKEKDWIVASHCYDCKAPMNETDRRCKVCGRQGGPHPKLRRRARGDRPYWSLSGFLGKEGAAKFLGRYCRSNELE